ncbi:DUF5675 family protein [Candidatus Gracilibacteria bacterium]|nr:DUF5675 family protein [Candidatus Gracilibacteria bacterium]
MKILAINIPQLNLKWFTDKGLNIEIEHASLDVKFPLKFLYKNENGEFHTPDIHNYLNANYKKYEYTFILYGYYPGYYPEMKNTGGYAHHTPLNSKTFWASVRLDGNENHYAGHELMHLIGHYINLIIGDRTPKDFMDYTPVGNPPFWLPYHLNNFPDNPESNWMRTWENYKKFLPQLNAIKYDSDIPVVVLKRAYSDSNQQLGDIIADGFTCKTLERAWKDNAKNISCIPKGRYECRWTFSPRFMKYTYEVMNVPNRSGIRFHGANMFFQLNGCIALGTHYGDLNHDKSADIFNSQTTINRFNAVMGKKPFILDIQ